MMVSQSEGWLYKKVKYQSGLSALCRAICVGSSTICSSIWLSTLGGGEKVGRVGGRAG